MPLILAVVEFRVAATHFFTQRPQEDGYLLTQSHISFDDGILNGGDRLMKSLIRNLMLYVGMLLTPAIGWAQGSELVGRWDGFSGSYADVWADGDYAFVAHFGHAGISIVDISDPANPVGSEYVIPPPNDTASAQDVKIWNGMMFVALEGNTDGSVHIVDVRDPTQPVEIVNVIISDMTAIHNVFVDQGFLYIADSGTPRVGIVDIRTLDPDNPPAGPITNVLWMVENIGTSFVHDITVQDGRLYAAAWDSGLWIYDVTNVATQLPPFLGQTPDGGDSTHSCWPTDNGDYVVTGEERAGGGIKVYRITDNGASLTLQLTDSLSLVDSTHNQVMVGYRLYNSWYADGLQVFDVDPVTGLLQFVTSYDTPNAWGVYPFRGVHEVLISDINNGLYIIDTDPPPPALQFVYPSGRPELITPSGGVAFTVEVQGLGGVPAPGTGVLLVDRGFGFESFPMTEQSPNVYEANFPAADCGTEIKYYVSADSTLGQTQNDPKDAPATHFTAVIGSSQVIAFVDDFESDLGWTVSGDATDGQWDRGVPVGGGDRGDPPTDADGSGSCFLTDNVDGNSDVDGGSTVLTSPLLDAAAPANHEAVVTYYRWYSNHTGAAPESDVFDVEISNDNGASWVILETVGPSGPEVQGGWFKKSFRIRDFVTPTNQMRLRFTASDLGGGSVVEAGVDGVQIRHLSCEETAWPDGLTVILGSVQSGGLLETFDSDDQYLVLNPQFLSSRYQLVFTVDATAPTDTPTQLKFNMESRTFNLVGFVQRKIELFNYVSGSFELVDTRNTTSADSLTDVMPSGDPQRFVQAGTGAMQVRISYQNGLPFWVTRTANLYLPFRTYVDLLTWTIVP